MKRILFLLITVNVFFLNSCAQNPELNSISFSVSKDVIVDSIKVATTLIDKIDKGSGASCFISNNKLYFPNNNNKGFANIEIDKALLPNFKIEPLNATDSRRIVLLVLFFKENNIDGIVKRFDKVYFFPYKQSKLNPTNNYTQYRSLVYIKTSSDTLSSFFIKSHTIDRYKNILLRRPD